MTVTHLSRRESRVTPPLRHTTCHTTPTRPDPSHPSSGYDRMHRRFAKAAGRATMHALRGGRS